MSFLGRRHRSKSPSMIEFRKPTCWVARHPNAGTYYDLIFKRSHIRKAATELRGMIKNAGRKLLGDSVVGAIDYYRKPQQKTSWDGPFNGQPARQELFKATLANIRPRALVETGIYFGTTTEFMAMTGLPVFTIEAESSRFGMHGPASGTGAMLRSYVAIAGPAYDAFLQAICRDRP